MLQHYSPFKVAETFKVLAALAGPRRSRHRQGTRRVAADHARAAVVPRQGAQAGLRGPARGARRVSRLGRRRGSPARRCRRAARAAAGAERILLGGSPDSGALAARNGWRFCYAGHFNGDDANLERSLDAYRSAGGTRPLVALYAVAAPTRDAAEQLIGPLKIFKLQFAGGQSFNLASAQAAAEFARQSGASDYRIDELRPTVLADTPERVHRALDALSRRLDVDAFVIDSPVTDYAARLASVEWLGGALSATPLQAALAADRALSLTRTRDAPMTTRRSIPFGLMLQGAGSHMNAWRHPSNPPDASINLDFAIGIARKAEAAGIAFAFVADGLYINESRSRTS